jgi:hypothetical protein
VIAILLLEGASLTTSASFHPPYPPHFCRTSPTHHPLPTSDKHKCGGWVENLLPVMDVLLIWKIYDWKEIASDVISTYHYLSVFHSFNHVFVPFIITCISFRILTFSRIQFLNATHALLAPESYLLTFPRIPYFLK